MGQGGGVSNLPERTHGMDGCAPRCPWCRADLNDAPVTVGDLASAHERGVLTGRGNWLYRGRRFDDGIPLDCPECAKPSLVRFVTDGDEKEVVIAPTRTAADARYEASHEF